MFYLDCDQCEYHEHKINEAEASGSSEAVEDARENFARHVREQHGHDVDG